MNETEKPVSFLEFTDGLTELLEVLKDSHFTTREAWFKLNEYYLGFAGLCEDEKLREEAFKLIKFYSDNIPLREAEKSKVLESPYALSMNIEELIDKRRKGAIIKADEVK